MIKSSLHRTAPAHFIMLQCAINQGFSPSWLRFHLWGTLTVTQHHRKNKSLAQIIDNLAKVGTEPAVYQVQPVTAIFAMTQPTQPIPLDLPRVDVSNRSVRILRTRANGFVEFEFSVGWPELMVELMLTEPDFNEFCQQQRAEILAA